MASYQVLAQKYRPSSFGEVIGQEAVARTVKNSAATGRVANAYIFCGPRGVGKTSMARLLAKTLNCEDPTGDGPCNRCRSCLEITRSSGLDVIEMDGASNGLVDNIRDLLESVKFLPSGGKYKVYIIDEVHMLSAGAFNALLKTLEEPPGHVKFIFATTEPHKVLATIMSRCQRFDLRRIPAKAVYEQIRSIAAKEGIDIEDKAAMLIASSSDGSMRDALVILDQMVSFSGRKIMADEIVELLGMVHSSKVTELARAVIDGDIGAVTRGADELINSGKDPVFIADSLITHFRNLMVIKAAGAPTSDMVFSEEDIAEFKKANERLSIEEIIYILQNLSHSLIVMKNVTLTRAPLELTLIRSAKRGELSGIAGVIKKLEGLDMSAVRQPVSATGASSGRPAVEEKIIARGAEKGFSGAAPSRDDALSAGGEISSPDRTAWGRVLDNIKTKKISLFIALNDSKLMEMSGDKIVLGFDQSRAFHKEVIESDSNMAILRDTLISVSGKEPRVQVKLLESFEGRAAGLEAAKKTRRDIESKEAIKPVLDKAMDIFGGHVVRDLTEGER